MVRIKWCWPHGLRVLAAPFEAHGKRAEEDRITNAVWQKRLAL